MGANDLHLFTPSTAMDNLAARIRVSLQNPKSEPWFPELAHELTTGAWDRLNRDIGLTPESYGTTRLLSRNKLAPRQIIASLETRQPVGERNSTIFVETLTAECVTKYEEAGISFYSASEVSNPTFLDCLHEAMDLIGGVLSLLGSVSFLVRSLHVIKPEDSHYDVSFSEPSVPFSIFVSVPKERTENDSLRVAEAVVHEAMHLQLTLIEQVLPLVAGMSKQYYSPWKRELRNAQGILHALYVFAVINRFLQELYPRQKDSERKYIRKRVTEINNQVAQSQRLDLSSQLTADGSQFVEKLFW